MFVAEVLGTRASVQFFLRDSISEWTALVYLASLSSMVARLKVSFLSSKSALNANWPVYHSLWSALSLADLLTVDGFPGELGIPGASTLCSFSCKLLLIVFTLCSTGESEVERSIETRDCALLKRDMSVPNCDLPLLVTDDP